MDPAEARQQIANLARTRRLSEEVALHIGASTGLQQSKLFLRFDADSGRQHVEASAEPRDGRDDGGTVRET